MIIIYLIFIILMHFSQNIDTLILVPHFDNFHDIHDLCYYFFPYILIQFLIFSNSKLPEMVSPFYLFFASVARFYLTCSVCLLPALFDFIFNHLQMNIFLISVNIMHGQGFVKGCYECIFFYCRALDYFYTLTCVSKGEEVL